MTPHLRPLTLLFNYLTTLARYDLAYEVRDRARFLSGLLRSAGIGIGGPGSKLGMDEEEFKKGVQAEDVGDVMDADEGRTMMAEHARRVLFEGKQDEDPSGECSSLT